jgi:hypothetical protein
MIREYRIKSVPAQFLILRKHFPELGSPDFELTLSELPPYAEGWLAPPRWEKLAPAYGEALHRVFDALIHSTSQSFFRSTPSVSSSKTKLGIDFPCGEYTVEGRFTDVPHFNFDAHKNSDSIRRCSVTRLARLLRRSFCIYGPLGK